jgi:predicted nucleic acid-binding protein
MPLLISDANIFIDLEIGKLTNCLFLLPATITVPDVLFEQELRARHSHLLEQGLQIKSIGIEHMVKVEELILKYPKPGKIDMLALTLAMQEQCPLLTGDKDLRSAARAENVEVHGMIWLTKIMLEANIIQFDDAEQAFAKMKQAGSRLPWDETEKMLNSFKTNSLAQMLINVR